MHMPSWCGSYGQLLGRILLGGLFFIAGVQKIFAFSQTSDFIGAVMGVSPTLAMAGAVLAIVIEAGAGLAIALGYHTKFAAGVLGIFILIVTLIFHPGWKDAMQMMAMTKNLMIVGGLLYMSGFSSTFCSMESKS